MITIPEPLTSIPPSLVWPKILLLYGQRKVGKTTSIAELTHKKKALILSTDLNGAEYSDGVRVQLNNMSEFDDACGQLKKSKAFEIVALDTLTTFEDWLETTATEDYKNSPQGKGFTGASVLTILSGTMSPGYHWLRMAFQRKMRMLLEIAPYIILITHLKDKYLKSLDNNEKGKDSDLVFSRDIDMSGKLKAITTTHADAIGFLYRNVAPNAPFDSSLWVSFETSEGVNCGSRCNHLKGQKFKLDWNKVYPSQTIPA